MQQLVLVGLAIGYIDDCALNHVEPKQIIMR